MKKSKKLLRKLLASYREEQAKKPFIKERSSLIDCVTVILETLYGQNRNS